MSDYTKVCLNCTEQYTKPHKVSPSTWETRQFCSRSCAAAVRNRSPIYLAKLSAAVRGRLADPVARERHLAAACNNIKGAHLLVDTRARDQRRAARVYGWCPESHREHYQQLRKRFGRIEARRLIEDEIAAEARRAIAKVKADMIARRNRELASAY